MPIPKPARLALALASLPSLLAAQTTQDTLDRSHPFFTRHDLALAGIALAGSAAVSVFDERIARWTQSAGVQGSSSRHDLVEQLTRVNETPLTLAALATYGVGRLAHANTVADVGLHTSESLILTVAISELLRGPIGRARPRESPTNAFKFELGEGFTEFGNRSYPSMHAAAAFATATTLVGEIDARNPGATKYAAPLLYGAALVPGLTRMYLNQHWTSDIVAGAFVGTLLGGKVIHNAHHHPRTKLDRLLLGTTLVPDGRGNVLIGGSFGLAGLTR
jgi:hypothetical protein